MIPELTNAIRLHTPVHKGADIIHRVATKDCVVANIMLCDGNQTDIAAIIDFGIAS